MNILTLLVFLLSFPVLAKRHIAYIGGGGEPDGPGTIFDSEIGNFGNFIKRSEDVALTVSFNGGHPRTENKLTNIFPQAPNRPFTPEAFDALVTQYESDIQTGRITSADQLMLFINTHGAEQQPGQTTHTIATKGGAISNFDKFSGPSTASLDRLKTLTTLAESKGIKLAIIDVSCHSGASLPLANSKTCVITATGPSLYGYAGRSVFSAHFVKAMSPGKNLEEIFHDVRDNTALTDFPMISAGAGKGIQEEIYPLLTRFLLDYEKKSPSKLKADIIQSVTTNSCEQENETLASLITLLSNVENVTDENFRKLKEAVIEYQSFRTTMQNQLRAMLNHPSMKETRDACSEGVCFKYTGLEVLGMDIDAIIDVAKNAAIKNPSQANSMQRWQNALVQLKPWKAQLMSNPALAGYPDFFKNYPGIESQSEKLAKRVSKEERRLYREMYKARASHDQASNPCRDFTL